MMQYLIDILTMFPVYQRLKFVEFSSVDFRNFNIKYQIAFQLRCP